MDIRIVISADESAQAFARNLGKIFSAYVSESDIEAGLAGKILGGIQTTIEPDTMPWEDKVEKGLAYADQAQKAAEANAEAAIKSVEREQAAQAAISPEELQTLCADLGERFGKAAFKELKAKAGFSSMKALDAKGRSEFADMINTYMKEHADA